MAAKAKRAGLPFVVFQRDFPKREVAPVYAIFGDERFFIQQAIDMIKEKALKDSDPSLCYSEHDGAETSADVILDELRTLPFLSQMRVVVVNSASAFALNNKEYIERYLASPSKTSCLVLVSEKWDKRLKVAKLVDEKGVAVECKKLYDEKLPQWIANRASRAHKKKIAPEAAHVLQENVGNDLFQLDMHLEKLAIFVGERARIEVADVEHLVGLGRTRTIFDLTDAVANKNANSALRVLKRLLDDGEDSTRIISMLAWQLRRIWSAKRILARGGDVRQVINEVKVNYYFRDKFMSQVNRFSEEDLRTKFAMIVEADVGSKTGVMDNDLLMQCLLVRLCA